MGEWEAVERDLKFETKNRRVANLSDGKIEEWEDKRREERQRGR